ncbi:VCBS domain-containing protein [Catenovulum adriaticum]|uniref:VCBS domain-containing protein n=1 Tax=Catenovulum adriaticum TaxID=2984846 RepID=A0ABY7AL66_9ALTE|nr:VCBS domain-containing protein [Catenovulum sp. TS8]WAJ69205.1 VCBS domain-containing protein [Catenovulum sp. TS8]
MKKNLVTLGLLLSLSACNLESSDDNDRDIAENTPAIISGDLLAQVSSDSSTDLSGSLTITDVDDGENKAISQSAVATHYGTFNLAEDGNWTYTLDGSNDEVVALTNANETLTDSIIVKSADGTSQTIVITIKGVEPVKINTPATISGDLAKTTINNVNGDLTGTVTVTDPDSGEASVVSQVSQATTYGTFSIDDAGSWIYTLTSSHTDVSALASLTDTLTDIINIESADGTMSSIKITITGPVITSTTSKVAKLTDTKTDDTGELRLKLADSDIEPLTTGKLTLSFKKEAGAQNNNPTDNDTDFKDAYIGLYGSSVSSGKDLIELKIKEGRYDIRNQDIEVDASFTGDEWIDVEFTWDATNASDTVQPLVTLSINSTQVTNAAFSSVSSNLSLTKAGLQYLSFKLADNDATVATAYYIDDIKIYSDTAGTVLIFKDDFESYELNATLESSNDESPYHSTTNEVVVVEQTKS